MEIPRRSRLRRGYSAEPTRLRYSTFVAENRERLSELPAPSVATSYYSSGDLYLFDARPLRGASRAVVARERSSLESGRPSRAVVPRERSSSRSRRDRETDNGHRSETPPPTAGLPGLDAAREPPARLRDAPRRLYQHRDRRGRARAARRGRGSRRGCGPLWTPRVARTPRIRLDAADQLGHRGSTWSLGRRGSAWTPRVVAACRPRRRGRRSRRCAPAKTTRRWAREWYRRTSVTGTPRRRGSAGSAGPRTSTPRASSVVPPCLITV